MSQMTTNHLTREQLDELLAIAYAEKKDLGIMLSRECAIEEKLLAALKAEIQKLKRYEDRCERYCASPNFCPADKQSARNEAEAFRAGRLALQRVLRVSKATT